MRQMWHERGKDKGYRDIDSMHDAIEHRTSNSVIELSPITSLAVKAIQVDNEKPDNPYSWDLRLDSPRYDSLSLTNWSFNQLCQSAGAHASYLKKLHPLLAAQCLNYGIQKFAERDSQLMLIDQRDMTLRANTSHSYGRIWDTDALSAVRRVNANGDWQYKAMTASDRDMFVFAIDRDHPIVVDNDILHRGFFVWNSEVGSQVWGFASFLWRSICDNRIVYGMRDWKELRIRHTSGGPARFEREGRQILEQYANSSAAEEEAIIRRAKQIPAARDKDGIVEMLRAQRFSMSQAKEIVKSAEEEEGQAHSLWDIVNGITAYARRIHNTDNRVEVERMAGKLLERAA